MNELTNTKKESISITKIRSILDQYDKLDYVINEKDKVASFDGNIILKSKKSESKSAIAGIIPIQIKSTEVSKFSRKSPSYQFAVSDINNFDLVDGVLLFLVEIISSQKTKVYFNTLLPYEINELKEKSKGKLTKSINFKQLESKRLNNIETVCTTFVYDRNKQKKVKIISDADISDFQNISFSVMVSKQCLMDYLLNNEVYLYGTKKDSNVEYLFDKVQIESIGTSVGCNVYVGEEKYYDSIFLENNIHGRVIKIGKSLSISDDRKITFKIKGNLYERIADCKFLISFLKIGKISFDKPYNKSIVIEPPQTSEIEKLYVLLDKLQLVKALFDYFNIEIKIDMDDYSKQDIKEIIRYAECIINKKELEVESTVGIYDFQVCRKKLCILVCVEDGQQVIRNYFNYDDKIQVSTLDSHEIRYVVPLYTVLTCKDILAFANFNSESVKRSIFDCEKSEIAFEACNKILLELLKAYDKNQNKVLLLDCEEISKYLLETYENKIIEVINYYQIIMRQRVLTDEEKERLLSLRSDYQPFSLYHTGINILLQNKFDVEYALKKMKPSERKLIVDYPLYTLYKSL